MGKLIDLAYYSPVLHKGCHRIWIDGKRLVRASLKGGVGLKVDYNTSDKIVTITIEKEKPQRVVAQKETKSGRIIPIIDLNNRKISEMYQSVESVQAQFYEGKIVISVQKDEIAKIVRTERLKNKLQNNLPLKIGTFCSGLGILDHAFEAGLTRAGIPHEMAFANELESNYLEESMHINSIWANGGMSVLGAMQQIDPNLLPLIDILLTGLPCVGASTAGRSKNKISMPEEHPEAGALFFYWLNMIKALNPSVVVLEEVVPYASSASMAVIRSVLATWGYDLHERTVSGNEMGVIEDRRRFFMVAVTKGIDFDFDQLVPVRTKEATVSEILEDIHPDDPRWHSTDKIVKRSEKNKQEGRNFSSNFIDTVTAEKYGCIGKSYMKRRPTEPMPLHPTKPDTIRLFTPVEHARGKGIPEVFVSAELSATVLHETFGNSVTYPAVEAVGMLVGNSLKPLADNVYPLFEVKHKESAKVQVKVIEENSGQLAMGF